MLRDFQINSWRVRPQMNSISGHGRDVRLEPKAMEVLLHLAKRAGEVVSKDELIEHVWEGRALGDEVITNAIWEVRKALGDDARSPRYIQTIPKRGYRLIADVTEATASAVPQSRAMNWRTWAALAAGALLIVLLLILASRPDQTALSFDAAQPASVAVLPIQDLSETAGQEYFADGLTEALITHLARLPSLRVISPTSVMAYKADPQPLPEVARQLDVQAVVEGTVLRDGPRVRISARLSDPKTSQQLWAQSYERDLVDILDLQSEVARDIARHVQARLGPADIERIPPAPSVAPQVHEAYLKGRFFWKQRTRQGLERAVESFQEAIRLDPGYAAAHAGLADAYIILADHRHRPSSETLQKARQAATAALQLQPDLAEAYTSMAWVRWVLEWDWEGAEQSFLKALDLNPNYATGHQWYGAFLEGSGRLEEAAQRYRMAQRLDPLSPILHTSAGSLALKQGELEAAAESYRKALELAPDFILAHTGLMKVCMVQGRWQQAEQHFKRLHEITSPEELHYYLLSPQDFEQSKRSQQLTLSEERYREACQELEQLSRIRHIPPILRAEVASMANRPQEALDWLEREIESHSREVFTIRYNPFFERLHDNPRFQSLLSSIPHPPAPSS